MMIRRAMRIVGGRHRRRRLEAPKGRGVRPMTDRTRESLFDVLQHSGWGAKGGDPLVDAAVLDAFCGTGALALEALSRGAAGAWLLDISLESLAVASRNVTALGETVRATLLRADATRPPPATAAATVAFIAPPYDRNLAPLALAALLTRGWLAPCCLCVVEVGGRDDFALPDRFATLDDRRYRDTRLLFLRLSRDDGATGR